MIGSFSPKDPSDLDLFQVNYASWLQSGESLVTCLIVTNPTTLTVASSTIVGTTVQMWLNGGSAGTLYGVTLQATSSNGRYVERSAPLYVKYR
jgi:hypothetical protein